MMGRDKAGSQAQSANQSAVDVQRSRANKLYVQGVALKQLVRVAQDKFDLGPGATKGWDAIADSPLFGQSRAFYKSVSDIKPILFGIWGIGNDNSPETVKLRDQFEKKLLPNYWDSDAEKKIKLNYLRHVADERTAYAAKYLNSVPDSRGRTGISFKPKDAPMLEGERLRRETEQHLAERKALGLKPHPPVTFTRRFLRGYLWNTSDSLNVADDVADNGINAALGRNDFHPGDAARNGIRDAGMRQELYARENPTKALIADTLSGYLSGKLEASVIKDSLEGAVRLAAPYATRVIKHVFKSEISNAEKQNPDSVLAAPLQVITKPVQVIKKPIVELKRHLDGSLITLIPEERPFNEARAVGTHGPNGVLDSRNTVVGGPRTSSATPARNADQRQASLPQHTIHQPAPRLDHSAPDLLMAKAPPAASVPDQGGIIYHPHPADFHYGAQDPAAGLYAGPNDMAHGAGYGSGQPGQSAAPAYQVGPFFDANGMPIGQPRQPAPFSFAVPTADQGTANFYAQLGDLKRNADAMAAGPYPNPGDAARVVQLADPRPVYPTDHRYGFGAGFEPDQVASGRPYAVAPQGTAVPGDDQGTIVYRSQPPTYHRYGAQPGVGLYGDAHYGLSYDDGAGGYAQDGSDGFDLASPAYVHAGGWQLPPDMWAAHGSELGPLVAAPGARFGNGGAARSPVIGGIIPLGLGAPARSDGSGSGSGSVPLYSSYTGYGGAGAVDTQPDVSLVPDPSGWSPRSAVRNILAIAPDDGQAAPSWLDLNTPPQIMINVPDLSGLIR